jgi:hypothetical protein
MASTYENDLRLEEMATGENSGSWGTKTNNNLELVADAFSYGTEIIANADTAITIADGAADAARSLALKITSSEDLTTTRVVTLGPNTTSKVWIIENSTSGGQTLTISAGSGSNVTLPNGVTKIIATDGIGAAANVTELYTNLHNLTVDDLTVNNDIIMDSDGAKIDFGSDSEIQLTHVADTGLLLTETGGGAPTLQFRDNALSISSSADGQLDIDADTEVQITAPTVDISADLRVDTNVFVVDATNNRIDINGGGSSATFDVIGAAPNDWAGRFENTSATGFGIIGVTASTDTADSVFELRTGTTTSAFKVLADNDWQVYNSTGNASMHWDASAASLGLGNQSTPRSRIDIYTGQTSGALTPVITMDWNSSTERNNFIGIDDADEMVIASDENDTGSGSRIRFRVDASDQVSIFADNKVDIGNTGGGSAPSSTLSVAGQVGTQNGTAAAPTHTFYSDTDTGMYRYAADGLAFSTGGTLRGRFNSGGLFLLPGNQTSASVTGAQRTFQIAGTDGIIAAQSIIRYSNDSGGPLLMFAKSRGTDPSTNAQALLSDGDYLAEIRFTGSDGTDLNSNSAKIVVAADGTQTSSSLPGMFRFLTTAGGNTSPTERLRLTSAGRLIHQEADVTVAQEAKVQFAGSNASSVWSAINTGDNAYSSLPNEVSIMNTVDNTTSSIAGIFMQAGETSSGSGVNAARIAAIREGNISTGLGMATRKSDGTMASRIYIRNDGNVGLSTDDPTRSLEIYRTTPKLSLYDSSDGSSGWDADQLFGAIQWRTADANVGGAGQINAYINVEHIRSGGPHTNPDAGMVFGISDGVTPTATDFMVLDNYGNTGQRFLRLLSNSDGIQFNGDTANANALDDYEEGDWTPSLEGTTTNPTVSSGSFSGRYRKIGDMVVVWFDIQNVTISGGSGDIQIPVSDLPYAPNHPFGREIASGSVETYNVAWPHDGTIGTRFEPSEGIQLQVSRNGGSWAVVSCANAAGSSRYIGGHLIYRTTGN